jgi:hypothetical protein
VYLPPFRICPKPAAAAAHCASPSWVPVSSCDSEIGAVISFELSSFGSL